VCIRVLFVPVLVKGLSSLTMSHFRQHYNELGKERIFPSLAVIEANFAINSVETVCPDSFFSKFAVVLRLMGHCQSR